MPLLTVLSVSYTNCTLLSLSLNLSLLIGVDCDLVILGMISANTDGNEKYTGHVQLKGIIVKQFVL